MHLWLKVSMFILITAGVGLWIYQECQPSLSDRYADFQHWPPTQQAIDADVVQFGNIHHLKPGSPQLMAKFGVLIAKRYRSRNISIPVLVRVVNSNTFNVEYPAIISPWDMEMLSLDIWRESHTILGGWYNFNLYRTYIGAPKRLSGTITTSSDGSHKAVVIMSRHLSPIGSLMRVEEGGNGYSSTN